MLPKTVHSDSLARLRGAGGRRLLFHGLNQRAISFGTGLRVRCFFSSPCDSPTKAIEWMRAPVPFQLTPRGEYVRVRAAREHNLKDISLEIPRNALVVFTGVSGSGKSSPAFGTLYAEAQRRHLESVSPYARRLFHQMAVPEVDEIEGLPPAVALQQQRGSPTTRSSVGSVTTLSNLLRMLYSPPANTRPSSRCSTRNRSRPIHLRGLPELPRHRPDPRSHRAIAGSPRSADHP